MIDVAFPNFSYCSLILNSKLSFGLPRLPLARQRTVGRLLFTVLLSVFLLSSLAELHAEMIFKGKDGVEVKLQQIKAG